MEDIPGHQVQEKERLREVKTLREKIAEEAKEEEERIAHEAQEKIDKVARGPN
jgi:hypothetical protein